MILINSYYELLEDVAESIFVYEHSFEQAINYVAVHRKADVVGIITKQGKDDLKFKEEVLFEVNRLRNITTKNIERG